MKMKRKSIKRLSLFLVIPFISFVFGLLVFNFVVMPLLVHKGQQVEVPNLIGKSEYIAKKELNDIGLKLVLDGSRFSSEIPEGSIIEQNIQPGLIIKKGRIVRVKISRGSETITAPDLTGSTLKQAKYLIKRLGLLQGDISFAYSDYIPVDRIITQYPAGGSLINKNLPISLLVSKGKSPEFFLMTDLIGKNFELAFNSIVSENLTIGNVDFIIDNSYPPGTIVYQDPLAYEFVFPETQINFKVTRSVGYVPSDSSGKIEKEN